ncbi:unnamed protein product [Scytosiphon promiscuus]
MTPEVPPGRADPTASKKGPEPAPGASTRQRWTSRSSGGYVARPTNIDRSSPSSPQTPGHGKGGNGGRFFSLPPCMMPHGGGALKVGEHLRGRLYNDDLERSSYVEVLGAAVVHTRTTGKAPLDAHGRPVGAPPGKSVVLAFPDRDKMAKVFRNREDMDDEDAERARVAAGGKPKKVAAVMGWLPFGKHGFLRTRQRRHARAHRGETKAEITDRGQLEVSLDGTRVLRMHGPSWFGLGRRDPTYELGVTDEGIEIRRGGEVVREVKANFV